MGLSGAQGLLGVTPDLTTLGKGVAGGVPLSVVAGKAEIMDLCADRTVVGAGTFNGYPRGVAAGLATISYVEREDGVFFRNMAAVLMVHERIDTTQALAMVLRGIVEPFFTKAA